jgi:hypothetical protein
LIADPETPAIVRLYNNDPAIYKTLYRRARSLTNAAMDHKSVLVNDGSRNVEF